MEIFAEELGPKAERKSGVQDSVRAGVSSVLKFIDVADS
jgi:hypothetical protein